MTTTSITSVSPPIRRTEMPFLLPKPTRIFLLAFFCYVQLLCSMVLNGFFTIVKQVAAFYGVSVQLVNLMGTIVYLLAALKFPAMYWTERFGVIPSLVCGMVFFSIGTMFIRLLDSGESFTCVFVGTVIAQLGQPFFQCLAASIPANYFLENERATPTALGIASDTTGVGVGMFLTGLPYFADNPKNFLYVCAGLNLLACVLFIPILLLIPNRGARSGSEKEFYHEDELNLNSLTEIETGSSPTNRIAGGPENNTTAELADMSGSTSRSTSRGRVFRRGTSSGRIKGLFRCSCDCPLFDNMYVLFTKCPEFTYSFLGVSLLFGVFNAHLTVISEVFPSEASANIYAGIFFLAGLLGNVIQGGLLDSNRISFQGIIKTVIVFLIVLFSCTAFIWTTVPSASSPWLYVLACLMGLGGPGLAATSIGFVLRSGSYQQIVAASTQELVSGSSGRRSQSAGSVEAKASSKNLESTVTGLMLLGFCLVTALLNILLNPETLGPEWGGERVLPWIWWLLSLPGYWLLWKACSLDF
ncbi:unnamed protein product [Amoebophrya sp. A120]|nr:unnamed protein product [Amoebophrya sp. A120]|eukprot:GSA120T00003849001.1